MSVVRYRGDQSETLAHEVGSLARRWTRVATLPFATPWQFVSAGLGSCYRGVFLGTKGLDFDSLGLQCFSHLIDTARDQRTTHITDQMLAATVENFFCSRFAVTLWQVVLAVQDRDNALLLRAMPLNANKCTPTDVVDLPRRLPKSWERIQ